MSKNNVSQLRVLEAAVSHGINISIQQMPASTRTAKEAADACECEVGQIVKSLIFENKITAN